MAKDLFASAGDPGTTPFPRTTVQTINNVGYLWDDNLKFNEELKKSVAMKSSRWV